VAGKVVGLDIGTSGVRAAELSLGKGAATLERFGQVALPPGAVRDGEVVDTDTVAAAIKPGSVTVQVPQVMDSRRLLWGSRVGR